MPSSPGQILWSSDITKEIKTLNNERERTTKHRPLPCYVYLQPKYILWTYVSLANPPQLQKRHKQQIKNSEVSEVTSAESVGLQPKRRPEPLAGEHVKKCSLIKKLGEKKASGSP